MSKKKKPTTKKVLEGSKEKITINVKCRDCGKGFDVETLEGMSWAHPSICDPCAAIRKQKEQQELEEQKEAKTRATIEKLPYPKWDSGLASPRMHKLRNTIGETVFTNGKYNGKSIWIRGGVDTGKSRSICFIAKTLIERGGQVNYQHCLEILANYSDSFERGKAREMRESLAYDPRVLILDDYGVGKVTERGAELLYFISDKRIIRGLTTWFTSNIFPWEICSWFPTTMAWEAERIASRITRYETILINEEEL